MVLLTCSGGAAVEVAGFAVVATGIGGSESRSNGDRGDGDGKCVFSGMLLMLVSEGRDEAAASLSMYAALLMLVCTGDGGMGG